MLNADWFFTIGKTHNICEDYAYSEVRDGTAIAVLSDGCSGSPDTDFGSRLLVRSAVNRLRHSGLKFDALRTIYQAAGMAKQIDLNETSLDATLLCLKVITVSDMIVNRAHRRSCSVWVQGDGMVVSVNRQGVFVRDFVFENGMPDYLSYQLDDHRRMRYQKETKGERGRIVVTHYDTMWNPQIPYGRDFAAGNIMQSFNLAHDDLLLAMSDGVHSFQRKNAEGIIEPVPAIEVVKQIVNIKSRKGEFLKRRCKKFFSKFCVENGWQNNDDFSVVAVDLRSE
jgi:hypothetical protein